MTMDTNSQRKRKEAYDHQFKLSEKTKGSLRPWIQTLRENKKEAVTMNTNSQRKRKEACDHGYKLLEKTKGSL